MSFVYRDGAVVVNGKNMPEKSRKRHRAVPYSVSRTRGLSTPSSFSLSFCLQWTLRSVLWDLPYQKGATGRRKPAAKAVDPGIRHQDDLRACDERSKSAGRCWGSHHPRPAVAVGEPPATNDRYGHTAIRAWLTAMHLDSLRWSESCRITVKTSDRAEVRSVSRYDKRRSIYPTPYTSLLQPL